MSNSNNKKGVSTAVVSNLHALIHGQVALYIQIMGA